MVLPPSDTTDVAYQGQACGIKILLATAHALWGELLKQYICSFIDTAEFTIVLTNDHDASLKTIFETECDILLVSSPSFFGGDIRFIQSIRLAGYLTDIILICSHYLLPSLDNLLKCSIQGIVCTSSHSNDLCMSINAVATGQKNNLKQQYIRVMRHLTHQPVTDCLSIREKEILQLVAADLSDHEIAEQLGVSVRTINNQLRMIYAKLGVRGRAGAVANALAKGIITPRLEVNYIISD